MSSVSRASSGSSSSPNQSKSKSTSPPSPPLKKEPVRSKERDERKTYHFVVGENLGVAFQEGERPPANEN